MHKLWQKNEIKVAVIQNMFFKSTKTLSEKRRRLFWMQIIVDWLVQLQVTKTNDIWKMRH